MMLAAVVVLLVLTVAAAKWIDFEQIGAFPNNQTMEAAQHNGNLLNATINGLQPGDTLFVSNKTFLVTGGIKAEKLYNVTFQIDGTIAFVNDRASWPKKADGFVEECIYLTDIEKVVFTSSGKGTLDGNGTEWWGAIKFLKYQEDRPRLMHILRSKDVLVENLLFKNSPYWTFWSEESDGLLIRHSDVDARWTNADKHTMIDLQAFNTDGFDVTGKNVHIHDCNIWNQDDCIAVKDGSANMLFERISCSGLGLVIGSIGKSKVQNITFRDSVMPRTFKGIYMKTRWYDEAPAGDSASISNILYQNITMDRPQQFAIWIGPAQQTGQPCSLLWPIVDQATCSMSGTQTWENIVLKDIFINAPEHSPGVLFGNATNPMRNVIFDNVVVTNAGDKPWGDDFYFCDGIHGVARGGTSPVPPCFKVEN
ncbi:hypothetical protein EON65_06860 [archaeon]|nr:MAG: hypothetical protein EON65_06860 [archaeon]